MKHSMVNWNGDQMCAVDVETTGLNVRLHEIIEIAVIPLTSNLEPRQDVLPFNITMRPDRPDLADPKALAVNHLEKALKVGFSQEQGVDLFLEWSNKLGLPYKKYGSRKCRMIPLGHNYYFDKGFIQDWLGPLQYEEMFFHGHRDTMTIGNFINDRASMRGDDVPIQKLNLAYVASKMTVPHEHAHSALSDALTCSKIYRKYLDLGSVISWE